MAAASEAMTTTTHPTATPLYEKQGRKYVPVQAFWYERPNVDQMKTGTFRLTYAHTNGARRYEYDVTPATAPTAAAMLIAKDAMVNAIHEASKMRPSGPKQFTKKQIEVLHRFRREMGTEFPIWWTEGSAHEIADAAIKAVLEFKP